MALTLAVVADTLGIAEKLPGENRQQYRARLAASITPYAVKKVAAANVVSAYEQAIAAYHCACMALGRVLNVYMEPDERNKPEEYDMRVVGFARKYAANEPNSIRGKASIKWLANNSEPIPPSATATKLAKRLN